MRTFKRCPLDTVCTFSCCFSYIFQNKLVLLSSNDVKVKNLKRGPEISYKIYAMGLYQVVEAANGLMLIWNKKTQLMLKLDPSFKVRELIDVFTKNNVVVLFL